MKTPAFILVLSLIFLAASNPRKKLEGTYTILPESSLTLFGTSNVTDFNCDCTQKWGSYPVIYETNDENTCWYFDEVGLSIEVRSLDCHHKPITKDLAKTLKADQYPYIHFKVLEAIRKDECIQMPAEECLTTWIDVAIEIAGAKKVVKLDVDCYHMQNDVYQFSVFHEIDMCDFNIEPPTALMGLIKVDQVIGINIDLRVRLEYS